ncbi:MAG: PAS domain-containing sensor histidine kinase [Bacteroidia bacterium]|nr:PAS domain-containing sensor histidine kinase [Bacteroidia bacterium]
MNLGLLDKIYDTFSFGVLIENNNREILYTNKSFRNIFELVNEGEDLKGLYFYKLVEINSKLFIKSENLKTDYIKIHEKGIANEKIFEMLNGKYFKRKYTPIYDNQIIQLHVWTFEDVTNNIEKQIDSDFQNNFYTKILDEIPADIAIFNKKHQYLYLNKTAVADEKTRKWLIGNNDFDYCMYKNINTNKAIERRLNFNIAVETKKTVQLIDEIEQKDGQSKFVLRNFHPVFDSNGNIEIVIGYGIDITKNLRNELIISNQKERISTLINELKEGVFQVDLNGEIISYNQSIVNLLNLNHLEKPEYFYFKLLQGISNLDKAKILTDFKFVSKNKSNKNGFFEITNERNEVKYLSYNVWFSSTIIDGETIIGTLSDITIQHEQNKYLLKNISKEKELNLLKSKFVNISSHELRTPLSIILSSVEIIDLIISKPSKDSFTNAKIFVKNIVNEVLHMTNILNELMIVEQIELGKQKFKPYLIHINDFIENINVGFHPYKDGRYLKTKINDDISNIFIDPELLKHGITNLLSNAFKYSIEKKEPELLVTMKNNQLNFRIKDFGIGIPENEINNLFQTFYRASNAEQYTGTGIGLVVVDYAVKAHKGTVKLKSKLNIGTQFEVSIPLINVQ